MSKTVRAISKSDDHLQSVVLRTSGSGWELLYYGENEQTPTGADTTVLGLDSRKAAFYQIMVPVTQEEQLREMITLQAEALLPLGRQQMEIDWRKGVVRDKKIPITIAAARSSLLERQIADTKIYHPSQILLEAEAVVKASHQLFNCPAEKCIILHLGTSHTNVCLTEAGQLTHAVILDLGREDVLADARGAELRAKRLEQDLQRSLELFRIENTAEIPLWVLSINEQSLAPLAERLKGAGWQTKIALPDPSKLAGKEAVSNRDVYKYIVPLGLGLLALDGEQKPLNLAQQILVRQQKATKVLRLPSLKISAALAALMLAALALISYTLDVRKLHRLEAALEQTNVQADINRLLEEQNIIQAVAAQRPDPVELLTLINTSGLEGVMLNNFIFKKGRPVTIEGETKKQEDIYKFQENLQKQEGIYKVRIPSKSLNEKEKKVTFTITFDYKNFSTP